MQKEFTVLRRMASMAKNLRKSSCYASRPQPKKAQNKLPFDNLDKIEQFYESDEISRVMPGRKDNITIVKDGVRESVQKRLLLFDLKVIHEKFKTKYLDVKISLCLKRCDRVTVFPLVGKVVTMCVCKTHQNMKLKFLAVNNALKDANVSQNFKTKDILLKMVCENSTESCFLFKCGNCPGSKSTLESLDKIFLELNIEEIGFKQWKNTDR